jgi:hypothetical protein
MIGRANRHQLLPTLRWRTWRYRGRARGGCIGLELGKTASEQQVEHAVAADKVHWPVAHGAVRQGAGPAAVNEQATREAAARDGAAELSHMPWCHR